MCVKKEHDVLRMETTHCRDGWQPSGQQGGTLSRVWRGALNAGIRAEGADDKLAYALRQTGLHPSCRPTWAPPRIDRNIDAKRGTNPQVKRTSSAYARLI